MIWDCILMTNYLGLHINEGLVWECVLMKGDLWFDINEGWYLVLHIKEGWFGITY